MSTYLIDFENVKSGGLAGIEHISKEDSVHLFWSARENKISIEMMELIRSSESEIVMHKAVTGERDALDHQLCSYLGFLAGGKGEKDFIIVSNDKAYDHLIEFWRCMNESVHIQRVPEISKVSEALVPKAVTIVPGETSELGDRTKTEAVAVEHATSDTFGNRNSRRRERGSKYLKGGRTGRGERKNYYSESHQEEVKTVDRVKEVTEYETEESKDSVAAYVVTGIKTGILVESGYTADGILDSRNNSANNADYLEKSDTVNDIEPQIKQPEHEKDEITAPYPETSDEEKTIPVWIEQPEEKTDISDRKEEVSEEIKDDNPIERSEKEAPEKEVSEKETPEKEEDDQKKNDAEKKNRPRAARSSGRAKRGRPPKKEHVEHVPEIREPVAEADVIAKCGDTADSEWTGEVARLINDSKDKKELYSAIVKLLGQEKGRTVYHEIKDLKL